MPTPADKITEKLSGALDRIIREKLSALKVEGGQQKPPVVQRESSELVVVRKDTASPQLENGYTRIANELLEALIKIRIPGEAMQILLKVFRQTYGYNKKEDDISLSQFCLATGLKKPNCVRAINKAIALNLIIKKDNGSIARYRFNKDYSTWKPLSKKITLSKKIMSVIKKDNKSLSKKIHTKEKKDNVTKEIYIPDTFKNYFEVLKSIPGYPYNEKTDLAFLQEKEKDHPFIDILSLLKGWKAYLADKPLNGKSKPRAQLHNQFEFAMKWGKHRKAGPKLKPEENILNRIREAERKVNSELSA